MVLIAKSSVKIHLSPSGKSYSIYPNTSNPSQIIFKWGGLPQQGGIVTTTYHCEIPPGSLTTGKLLWYAPRGVPQRGINENFTPVKRFH